jgi:hypothetical protein
MLQFKKKNGMSLKHLFRRSIRAGQGSDPMIVPPAPQLLLEVKFFKMVIFSIRSLCTNSSPRV